MSRHGCLPGPCVGQRRRVKANAHWLCAPVHVLAWRKEAGGGGGGVNRCGIQLQLYSLERPGSHGTPTSQAASEQQHPSTARAHQSQVGSAALLSTMSPLPEYLTAGMLQGHGDAPVPGQGWCGALQHQHFTGACSAWPNASGEGAPQGLVRHEHRPDNMWARLPLPARS
jgi:hypothetical protein